MRLAAGRWALAAGMVAAAGVPWTAQGQAAAPPQSAAPAQGSAPAQTAPAGNMGQSPQVAVGGRLHGVVKSGNIPLPGVAVTAQNTLTGKKYSTTTDITGAWSMNIPQNGRYVIRTQFAAFAQGSEEAVLNAASHDQAVNFALLLASRAAALAAQQAAQSGQGAAQSIVEQALRQLAGNAPQSLSLTSALSSDTETGGGVAGAGGAALPSIAGNTDFRSESVAISGQSGQVSPLAGVDLDRLRDQLEAYRQQNGGQLPNIGGLFGGPAGGGGFGGGGFGGGGFGGGIGFGGGGRGNFRGFNPGQPHGAIFWSGNNSALNAEPFSLRGQPQQQPASGSNRFGLTFMSAPYIPHLTKPSGKDTVFLTFSGTRSSNPDDFYGTVPTEDERSGNFVGLPEIFNPATGQQFISNGVPNVIPPSNISPQASALLNYFPQPNIAGNDVVDNYNYHLLTTAQSNSTQAGIRYMRSLGANATQPTGRGGMGGGRRSSQSQGLRQSINSNFNYSDSASDMANLFPILGGKSASHSYSLAAGYTVGYHKFTNIFSANWNRSDSQATNFFTNTSNNVAEVAGVTLPNDVPLNYGLPDISLSSSLTGLSETEPSFSLGQTISFSETLSWIHGKHNLRFGGDYRRVHRDFLAGSNATGDFTFTGLFTENAAQDPATGSAFADFLLGLPQSTSINSSIEKSYLRDNVVDAYALDDWRMRSNLTLNYGVRYEFFAPYTEKNGRLAEVLTNPDGGFTSETEAQAGANGLPGSLVYPWRRAFRPSVGIAWRVPKIKQTVVRAGFGMNYTVGEYATFATTMAHQPPFTDEQTNQEASGNAASTACLQAGNCFTLANGFPAPATLGNYALDPHYPLPYVQAWNLDIQKTLPWGVLLNLGYNGTRGNHLDTVIEPRSVPASPGTDPAVPQGSSDFPLNFQYEEAVSFSKFNAATVRLNKRLSKGIAMGANYTYSHSTDDAGAEGSVGGVSVQDWQNVLGELGNSSLDVRHKVSGTYLYELPFGKDKFWLTTGAGSHIMEGFSVSGSFTFATGTWLTPSYQASVASTTCGLNGVLRPNLTGAPIYQDGGSLRRWFNPAAYAAPTNTPGYCNYFGDAPRNSIEGPGTVTNNMALSKTIQFVDTRSMEIRATLNNDFNTVQ